MKSGWSAKGSNGNMADNIGTAYVQIEPSFEGVTPKIEQHFDGEGEKASKSFGNGFASVVGTVGKAFAGAAAAGATAVAGLTKQAVSSFSEFEQLRGGAELLFGDAFGKVLTDANHAFSDVQMSVNDYLATANSYATGLKEALGGDEMAAADLTNKIITAQADIVAATGNSSEAVSNAFAGIMKNNFSMLDNLQLGIKPTKEGMQEVIDKMNEWNAEQGHATQYQMGNLADMQSAIVDYVSYVGMAGYAHNEASSTIEGALATAKASWENLLTAIAVGDMDTISTAIENLVSSASQLGANLQPVIEKALGGISILITEMGPQIAAALPDMISQVLPGLLSAGVDIVKTLGEGILQALPDLMPTITDVILQLCDMLVQMLPQLIEVGMQVILQLAMGIAQALPELIPTIVETVLTIATYLIDNVDLLIDAAIALIIGLAEGLIEALPKLIEKAPEIVTKLGDAIIRNAPKILGAAISLILTLIEGIVKCWGKVFEIGAQIIEKIKGGFNSKSAESQKWGRDLIDNFINGIKEKWEHLKQTVGQVAESIKSYLGFSEPEEGPLSNFHTYAPDMMELYAKGITENAGLVKNALTEATSGLMNTSVDVSAVRTIQTNNESVSSDSGVSMGRVAALLETFVENFKQEIYLDTGVLVGATAPAYNTALGQIAVRGGNR
jgi:phage-related protein